MRTTTAALGLLMFAGLAIAEEQPSQGSYLGHGPDTNAAARSILPLQVKPVEIAPYPTMSHDNGPAPDCRKLDLPDSQLTRAELTLKNSPFMRRTYCAPIEIQR